MVIKNEEKREVHLIAFMNPGQVPEELPEDAVGKVPKADTPCEYIEQGRASLLVSDNYLHFECVGPGPTEDEVIVQEFRVKIQPL